LRMDAVHVQGLGQGTFCLGLGDSEAFIRVRAMAQQAVGERVFSPTDLVAAALGSCLFAVMEVLLERWGYNPSDFRLTVKKEMADVPRRIGALTVTVIPPFPLEALEKKKLERAMALCPVKKSLGQDVRVTILWEEPHGDSGIESAKGPGL